MDYVNFLKRSIGEELEFLGYYDCYEELAAKMSFNSIPKLLYCSFPFPNTFQTTIKPLSLRLKKK